MCCTRTSAQMKPLGGCSSNPVSSLLSSHIAHLMFSTTAALWSPMDTRTLPMPALDTQSEKAMPTTKGTAPHPMAYLWEPGLQPPSCNSVSERKPQRGDMTHWNAAPMSNEDINKLHTQLQTINKNYGGPPQIPLQKEDLQKPIAHAKVKKQRGHSPSSAGSWPRFQ